MQLPLVPLARVIAANVAHLPPVQRHREQLDRRFHARGNTFEATRSRLSHARSGDVPPMHIDDAVAVT